MSERIDFDQVREVIRVASEADLAELEVETPTLKVRVRRGAPAHLPVQEPAAAGLAQVPGPDGRGAAREAALEAAAGAEGGKSLDAIVAPMVGTVYRSPSPDAPPFVAEGDYVKEGQVVCVIEAMKLFNEIQADRPGRLARVLVDNGVPVEYGQPLFLVDTSST
jgi:acetyl-CoA carboxylase biotin carboxyl carrier protein